MFKKPKTKETRGRKPIGQKNKAIQIPGEYFTPNQIKELGGKEKVKELISIFANELKKSVFS
jgi:hypothetical protein